MLSVFFNLLIIALYEEGNPVMVAFCDSVGARKIQDFVLEQVFGHYYCTDVAELAQLSRAHTRFNVVTFLLSITFVIIFVSF